MTNSTIGWCDKCNKEVSLDHNCMKIMKVHKLKEALERCRVCGGLTDINELERFGSCKVCA